MPVRCSPMLTITLRASALHPMRARSAESLRRTVVALPWTVRTSVPQATLSKAIAIGVIRGFLAREVVMYFSCGVPSRSGSVCILPASDQPRRAAAASGEGRTENRPTVNRPCWHGFPLSQTLSPRRQCHSIPWDGEQSPTLPHNVVTLRSPPEVKTCTTCIDHSPHTTRAIPAEGTAVPLSFIPTRCRDVLSA